MHCSVILKKMGGRFEKCSGGLDDRNDQVLSISDWSIQIEITIMPPPLPRQYSERQN